MESLNQISEYIYSRFPYLKPYNNGDSGTSAIYYNDTYIFLICMINTTLAPNYKVICSKYEDELGACNTYDKSFLLNDFDKISVYNSGQIGINDKSCFSPTFDVTNSDLCTPGYGNGLLIVEKETLEKKELFYFASEIQNPIEIKDISDSQIILSDRNDSYILYLPKCALVHFIGNDLYFNDNYILAFPVPELVNNDVKSKEFYKFGIYLIDREKEYIYPLLDKCQSDGLTSEYVCGDIEDCYISITDLDFETMLTYKIGDIKKEVKPVNTRYDRLLGGCMTDLITESFN